MSIALLAVAAAPSTTRAFQQTGGGVLGPIGAVGEPASASASTSTEGALFLLLPVGARGVGMGRAMTALQGAEAVFWNPAGVAPETSGGVLLYRGDHFAAEATAISVLVTNESLGALALSYELVDFGDQELRDADGNLLAELSVRNHLAVLTAATNLAEHFQVGANLKVILLRNSCRGNCTTGGVSATSYAVDLGFQAQPLSAIPLRLAGMVAHLGPRVQVVNAEQADPLPTRMRFAAAYQVLEHFVDRDDLQLWPTVELEDRWRDPGDPAVFMGAEFRLGTTDFFTARAGYLTGDASQTDGVAVGLGLRYQRFLVELAKSLSTSPLTGETEPVHISFGVSF